MLIGDCIKLENKPFSIFSPFLVLQALTYSPLGKEARAFLHSAFKRSLDEKQMSYKVCMAFTYLGSSFRHCKCRG